MVHREDRPYIFDHKKCDEDWDCDVGAEIGHGCGESAERLVVLPIYVVELNSRRLPYRCEIDVNKGILYLC
jgi:hypothetical protein